MTTHDLLVLAAYIVGSILTSIVINVYRAWRRARHGPSQKEFTNAVATVTAFIEHHNRVNPEALIKTITISPTPVNVSAALEPNHRVGNV